MVQNGSIVNLRLYCVQFQLLPEEDYACIVIVIRDYSEYECAALDKYIDTNQEISLCLKSGCGCMPNVVQAIVFEKEDPEATEDDVGNVREGPTSKCWCTLRTCIDFIEFYQHILSPENLRQFSDDKDFIGLPFSVSRMLVDRIKVLRSKFDIINLEDLRPRRPISDIGKGILNELEYYQDEILQKYRLLSLLCKDKYNMYEDVINVIAEYAVLPFSAPETVYVECNAEKGLTRSDATPFITVDRWRQLNRMSCDVRIIYNNSNESSFWISAEEMQFYTQTLLQTDNLSLHMRFDSPFGDISSQYIHCCYCLECKSVLLWS